MVDEREVMACITPHVTQVLKYAELAMDREKFECFRKLALDEFGHSGLRRELAELLDQGDQSGMERQGQGPVTGRKGGAP